MATLAFAGQRGVDAKQIHPEAPFFVTRPKGSAMNSGRLFAEAVPRVVFMWAWRPAGRAPDRRPIPAPSLSCVLLSIVLDPPPDAAADHDRGRPHVIPSPTFPRALSSSRPGGRSFWGEEVLAGRPCTVTRSARDLRCFRGGPAHQSNARESARSHHGDHSPERGADRRLRLKRSKNSTMRAMRSIRRAGFPARERSCPASGYRMYSTGRPRSRRARYSISD